MTTRFLFYFNVLVFGSLACFFSYIGTPEPNDLAGAYFAGKVFGLLIAFHTVKYVYGEFTKQPASHSSVAAFFFATTIGMCFITAGAFTVRELLMPYLTAPTLVMTFRSTAMHASFAGLVVIMIAVALSVRSWEKQQTRW